MNTKQYALTDLRRHLKALTEDLERKEVECREIRLKRNAIANAIAVLADSDSKIGKVSGQI